MIRQIISMKKSAFLTLLMIVFLLTGCASYKIATEETYILYSGGIDIYHATKEELTALDLYKEDRI